MASPFLTVRARLRQAEQRDLTGALVDLRAALHLRALMLHVQSPYGFGQYGSTAGLLELLYLAQEVDLPPALAAEMIDFLTHELAFMAGEALSNLRLGSEQAKALLDQHYTDDGTGNGWLVLSTLVPGRPFGPSTRSVAPSGFWNLFSGLFNDRRTVAGKLARLDARTRDLDELDYNGVLQAVRDRGDLRSRLSILDAPLAEAVGGFDANAVTPPLADLIWRRAAVVMLALSAYRHDHGQYPTLLDELAPAYLPVVPRDLLTNGPFVYRRGAPDSYVLRSRVRIPDEVWPRHISAAEDRSVAERPDEYSLKRLPAEE